MTVTGGQTGSIFEHVRAHLPESGPGLREGGETLPDDAEQPGRVRWAPGAWDGVVTHHMRQGESADKVERLVREVRFAAAGWPGSWGYARLYRSAQDHGLVTLLDPLLARLREPGPPPPRLHRLGLCLATEARHRGPVKLGISLLGLFPAEAHRDVLLTLGRHEEFTLYAAVALANGQAEPEDDLWRLARLVTGWGRIHLVERLARSPRADIRDWILREGFRNSIMYEYLAHTAATCGDLAGRLRDQPDDDLLCAAGEILAALFAGGPAPGIEDYADGAAATERLVTLLEDRASDLRHLLAVDAVRQYVSQERPEAEWPPGWTPHLLEDLKQRCDRLIDRPGWAALVHSGLASPDPETFHRADRAARGILGISTLSTHVELLRDRSPLGNWYSVMAQVDEHTIDPTLSLALELFPLAQIATGPADEPGFGPEFQMHRDLDAVLHELRNWPGRGWPLLAAGLASPVTRNRNLAVRALADWPRETWPPDAATQLRAAAAAEPVPELKERLTTVLNGDPGD